MRLHVKPPDEKSAERRGESRLHLFLNSPATGVLLGTSVLI